MDATAVGVRFEDPSRPLTDWLTALVSSDAGARRTAVDATPRITSAMLPVIVGRLSAIARSADRDAMALLLSEVTRNTRGARADPAEKLADGGRNLGPDWLRLVLDVAAPERPEWRDLTSVLALSRCLAGIGTAPAVRELAGIFSTFGELLRLDVEREILGLGDRAVPALIELRRAEGKDMRLFALRLLEALGKAIPGEAVQTSSDELLAEVLRAYGRAKELDAVRVVISFANSDRRLVREAAREAVTTFGEVGVPALCEAYENWTSQKCPEGARWEIISSELFAVLDRSRLVDAYSLMDEGLAASKKKNVEAAVSAFDRVLARAPDFERRSEMATGYLEFARAIAETDPPRAMASLRKALRVDPAGPRAREAESALLLLEALDRARHGIVDETGLRRALELDAGNEAARAELQRIEATSHARSRTLFRYWAGALAAAIVLAGGAAAFGRGRRLPG
jgi:tetratricopeptide (TPR) repeat protein